MADIGNMRIDKWLEQIKFPQYKDIFHEHEIDADALADLTAEDLERIGVLTVGHRRKLLSAIAALRKRASVSGQAARLLTEAREVVTSGNSVATLFILGAIVWWFASLLPLDLSGRATGTASERLGELTRLAEETEKACQRSVEKFVVDRNKDLFSRCVSRYADKADQRVLRQGRNYDQSIDLIGDELDSYGYSSAECAKDVSEWRKTYLDYCEVKRARLESFVDELTKQGNIDIAGVKIGNIHPKWHATVLLLIFLVGAFWLGIKRRRLFQLMSEYLY